MNAARLLFVFLFASASVLAQAEECPLDTLLHRLYGQAASLMGEGKLDEAQTCFDSAFALPGANQSPVYPTLLNEQATLYVYQGNEAQGLEGKKSVLPYLPNANDPETPVSVYNDLGILYRRAHEPDSALYYYDKALDAAVRLGDESWLAHLNMNVAVFHYNLKRFAEAEAYIGRAVQHALRTDERLASFNAWQVGANIKLANGHAEEAGNYIRQAWQMACAEQNAEWKIRCMSGFFAYFDAEEQPDSLRHYLRLGNRLLHEVAPQSIAARGFIQARAKAQMQLGRFADALQDYSRLLREDIGTDKHTLFADMARCHQALGHHQQAFACMDSARLWTDSLARQELTGQIARLNVKYHTQEQALQNARLHEQLLQREASLLKATIAALCLAFLVLLLLGLFRQKQKAARQRLARLQQEKEREAARRYIEGLEEECKYFAQELHDGIANELLALQMRIETTDNPQKDLPAIARQTHELRQNVRAISHELMPPDFERIDLYTLLERYAGLLADSTHARIHCHSHGHAKGLDKETAREIYRIAQEILANCLKHAHATDIDLLLDTDADGHCILVISDNGTDAGPLPASAEGIGLRTVAQRAQTLKAACDRKRANGKNIFTLTLQINSKHD